MSIFEADTTKDKAMNWQDFVGKTIDSVDDSAVNCVHITFTDGTKVDIFAECGNSDFSIPFFDIQEVKG